METRYPTLTALRRELSEMEAADRMRSAADARERERVRIEVGRDVHKVEWLGGVYWLTPSQGAVVRMLMEAAASGKPDVDQYTLSRAAGRPRAKVADIFRDVNRWERLVYVGARSGTYRLASAPAADEPGGDGVRVVPLPEDELEGRHDA